MSNPIEVKFTIKESENGTPFVNLEPMQQSLSSPIFLHFKAGKTIEEASKIARFLNENIESISIG
jgi:hypothetical protein